MAKMLVQRPVHVDTTFGSLLRELQHIWDEVGETEAEMDKMLLELEQECLEVYRRKVDQASHARARLHLSLAEKEGELASLFGELGERPVHTRTESKAGTLKEQLAVITPQLEDFRLKKEERIKQLSEVRSQIQKICGEISGSSELSDSTLFSKGDQDLSVRRLDEHHAQLQALQKEKSDRLHKVLECVNVLHELCAVLGMDFFKTINEVHPSLNESGAGQAKSISNETLERLANTIRALLEERKQRMQTLQTLAASLTELWKLMDTPLKEQRLFHHVIDCLGVSDFEVSAPGALSLDVIEQAKNEVQKLDQLKASKMKELVLKKRTELEEVCRRAHMEPDASTAPDQTNALIDSGMVEASELLANMEDQIVMAKEEAQSRKEILDRVDKWLAACEEESWLEDYNMDDNRYNAKQGAHISLKRAERARITVTKLPALVDALIVRTRAWEDEKGIPFVYDGVRLLSMLDDYSFTRHQREEEKRRMRDQKRFQEQMLTEQETFFGSRPSPNKPHSSMKRGQGLRGNGSSTPSTPSGGGRRLSMRPGTPDSTPRSNGSRHHGNHNNPFGKDHRRGGGGVFRPSAPLNFVAMQKDDTASLVSACGSDPCSPMAAYT